MKPSLFAPRRARPTRASAMRGATLVEMSVSLLIFLMVIFAIAEVALMFKAKAVVDMAALAAARAGAVDHARAGPTSKMHMAGRTALAPLYMRTGTGSAELASAIVRAHADLIALNMSIDVLNPTAASFADHGVNAAGKPRFIPNDSLMYRSTRVKATSGQNIQDANLLKIRLTYCYEPRMPLANEFLRLALSLFNGTDMCRIRGRLPIRAEALVRMQTEAYQ
ncbi:TadE/TadG family type IV pilus assembly protein [Xenophilus sp. Marseille-Q4582]|uniref:TadE/TadG family type IV pilus assembly protein n=1 Tax=Xenophilus sp. Marseille-Q4582 TaxID=2866600 RepID=UPI001CE3C68C|nr:TadE/TadG family type IV pilus assembly protein [Xenophilus sp. Marseille-Q4582]